MKLNQIGEFGLIRRLARGLPCPKGWVGIGDDAAVIPRRNENLLITTDMLIEGRHFRRDWGRSEWIGERALRVNISDIAAMGGDPTSVVISLGIPRRILVEEVEAIYRGIRRVAKQVGISIVGGDTNRSRELTISVTLLGRVRGKPVLRSGAKEGDSIYVTGVLGEAGEGLAQLRRCPLKNLKGNRFVRRYWFPPIRVPVGRLLQERRAHAMIDISDGLFADVRHLLEAGKVGAEIWLDKVPLGGKRVRSEKEMMKRLSGGDDYELLFTHSAKMPPVIARVPITCIGRVRKKSYGLKVRKFDGEIISFSSSSDGGYVHF